MRIVIDTDGSTVSCHLIGCLPTASHPNVDPRRSYSFKEADDLSKAIALNAFRIIEEDYKRNN